MVDVTFTDHAYRKLGGDVDLAKRVVLAAKAPTVTYPNGRFPGQVRCIRDGMVAVVAGTRIVTFYANIVETDIRPDQTDDDAKAYQAKRNAERAKRDRKRQQKRDADRAFTAAQKAGKGRK